MKPIQERKESKMEKEKIIVIKVVELEKNFIIEEIDGIRYGWNPKFVDEDLLNDLRNTTTRKEVI